MKKVKVKKVKETTSSRTTGTTIQTKLSVGDTIFYLENNSIKEGVIAEIRIIIVGTRMSIVYHSNRSTLSSEPNAFISKEEAKEWFIKQITDM